MGKIGGCRRPMLRRRSSDGDHIRLRQDLHVSERRHLSQDRAEIQRWEPRWSPALWQSAED